MMSLRVLLILLAAVAVGVGIDLLTGVEVPGYGAGLGVAGVIVLRVGSDLLGRVLRRDERDADDDDAGDAGAAPGGVRDGRVDRGMHGG